ncbi:solute carrier family 23 member 2-like, partial [Paramuricea clavata]
AAKARVVQFQKSQSKLSYSIEENPPWYLAILLGFQHYLTMFGSNITIPLVLASPLCINDDVVKGKLISTIFFMSGIATLLQTIFGNRLPIVQGGTFSYLIPAFSILTLPEFACPPGFKENPSNSTFDGIWKKRMVELQGAVMVSSLFQIFIGFSGLMGFLLRFIGPLTVAPTISLVGLSLYGASADFAGKFSVTPSGVARPSFLGGAERKLPDFSGFCPPRRQKNFGQCTILGVKKIFRTTNIFRNITQIFENSQNLPKNSLNFRQNEQNLFHFFLLHTKIARLLIEFSSWNHIYNCFNEILEIKFFHFEDFFCDWGGDRPPLPPLGYAPGYAMGKLGTIVVKTIENRDMHEHQKPILICKSYSVAGTVLFCTTKHDLFPLPVVCPPSGNMYFCTTTLVISSSKFTLPRVSESMNRHCCVANTHALEHKTRLNNCITAVQSRGG